MARLASQEKLLYYPTPSVVVEHIATYFRAPSAFWRAADPCCGTGAALRQLVDALGGEGETWGVELSPQRAQAAEPVLDVVLPTSFYTVSWADCTVSLVLNNPPYDWSDYFEDGKRVRHERLFVTRTTPRVVLGGHQVILIPQQMLADEVLARHLAGYYERLHVARFPDGEYERFQQVVVFALRRRKYHPPHKEQVEAITGLASIPLPELRPLPTTGTPEILPPAPRSGRFAYVPQSTTELLAIAHRHDPTQGVDWQRMITAPPLGAPIQTAMPERIGHLAMEIASGEIGAVDVEGTLVKGMSRKTERLVSQSSKRTETGQSTRYEYHEDYQVVLSVLDAHGLRLIDDPEEVGRFIEEHAQPLGEAILKRNAPLYDLDPTPQEWETVSRTATAFPALPGVEPGLLETQKHVAIAAARVMRKRRHALINAMMGFGKTLTAIAAAEVLDEWPLLVVAPGHMLHKWRRTLDTGGDPEHPITARVITRPVRQGTSWWETKALPAIEAAGGSVLWVKRFQVVPEARSDSGNRRTAFIACPPERRAAVLKALRSLRAHEQVRVQPGGLEATLWDRDDYTLADFAADYRAGLLGRKAAAVVSFESAKYGPGVLPAMNEVTRRWQPDPDSERDAMKMAEYRRRGEKPPLIRWAQCPTCGWRTKGSAPVVALKERYCPDCGQALLTFSRWRRTGLSALVQHQYRGFFRLYLMDEVHKAKGGSTDIGAMDGRLLSAIPYSLALTGTVFGGTASSLFYLLYRRVPAIRARYTYASWQAWVDDIGRWKTVETRHVRTSTETGLTSGREKWSVRRSELPGIHPGVIRYLLPITIFGHIADLGVELPPLFEEIRLVPTDGDLDGQLADIDAAFQNIQPYRRTARDISRWFTALRFRPSAAFREEMVELGGTNVYLPALDDVLPKEEALIEIVAENTQRGRKTLIYVEQTGTRDIRPRLRRLLHEHVPQARVNLLSAGDMPPAQREAWIEREAPRMTALLVNPSLVETGLDLIAFSEIVFYEMSLSLYTAWQAMRRVWRLGQRSPVRVTFLAYEGTLEHHILDVIGEKMKSAAQLYGDNAVGALIQMDEADIRAEAIRRALEGVAPGSLGEMVGVFAPAVSQPEAVQPMPEPAPVAAEPLQLAFWGEAVPAQQVQRRRRRR